MNPLFIIPARGGSKGIPHKNIKLLAGKPLIAYSIDVARQLTDDAKRIIVSTDDDAIAEVAAQCGAPVPFMRPDELSTDTAGSREVILHAMDYADNAGIQYDCVVLLQPTSPFRNADDVRRTIEAYDSSMDMAVSVIPAKTNPYLNCYELDDNGFLNISKGDGNIKRRQDAPQAWEFNGAVYVINPIAIRSKNFGDMTRRRPVPMDPERSIDLDSMRDWLLAEYIISSEN
jgi:N-acylneuraminate cytidylyltransferase